MKTLCLLSTLGLMAAASDATETAKGSGKAPPVKKVKVRALITLGEGDHLHEKGAEFETTTERAAALGELVEVVK